MVDYYNYYLVALNFENKEMKPRIINLNNNMLNEEDEKQLINLAYIDNLTSKYEEGVFRRYLFDKKIIDNLYTPVFVVRRARSFEMDKSGHRKVKNSIKFYSPIFKSKDSSLINNLALTTLRQRTLDFSEASYLLNYFEALYYNNEEYRDIVRYIINEHDIKHLLNYKYYAKDKKSNPIKYNLLRDVVSSLYEFEKNKTFEKFMGDVYGRDNFIHEILSVLPEKVNVKKADLNPITNKTLDEIDKIKEEKWDNMDAKKQFQSDTIKDRDFRTLTLEDRLRAGLIDSVEYSNRVERNETKFRK